MMRFVAEEGDLRRLEAALESATGWAQAELCAALAWQLRQRDTQRALALATQAEQTAAAQASDPIAYRKLALRLALVRGEAQWLFAQLDLAHAHVDEALAAAQALADPLGEADAHWLRANLAYERGNVALRDLSLEQCAQAAARAGDTVREAIAHGALARWAVLRDPPAAEAAWGPRFPEGDTAWPPGVATWVHDYLSLVDFARRDFGRSTMHRLKMHDDALATGQMQRAIIAMTNVGACFANLNDHETALEWVQRGLELARRAGWPVVTATALLQCGGILRQLGRLDAAQDMLLEARATPGLSPASRAYAMILQYLGEVLEERKEHAQALQVFTELGERAAQLDMSDMLMDGLRGRAAALAGLGQVDEALPIAEAALALCEQHGGGGTQLEVLLLLADLYGRDALPPPAALDAPTPALHYLYQALHTAEAIEGYTVHGQLYEALAREHARLGDHAQAYAMLLKAGEAREKTMSTAALNRSIAMQIGHQTERARAEAEHHRELAATLQQTTVTLERLSTIGQEITRHLDTGTVFETLHAHVNGLLDATHFSIYLLDDAGDALHCAFGIEDGKPLPPIRLDLHDATSNVARCARERIEIARQGVSGYNPNHIPGTLRSSSLLFAPLAIGDRVLGVMTIQSPRDNAYGEREQLIFRTLCAYGAIALDNARAYRRLEATLGELRQAQAELVEKNGLLERAYRQQEEVSLTDPLTHLRNRRFLVQHIESEAALTLRRRRTRRSNSGRPSDVDLVFFMIDVDHFKSINDQYGHSAGDLVLVQMAERLRQVARETDYLIRWGGEEFLLVARATDAGEAAALAERIRVAVAERAFDIGQGFPLRKTCSVGFACFPFFPTDVKAVSWSQTVELADQALYMAKAEGRDRWVGLYAGAAGGGADSLARIARSPRDAAQRGELAVVRGPMAPA